MALTYLQLCNRVIVRLGRPKITDVTTATGDDLTVTELINDAQLELYGKANWYSLYTSRTFNTVAGTATYAVASDFGRNLALIDTTNDRILKEGFNKDFDTIDPDASSQNAPRFFSIQGGYYRLYEVPAGAYSITDRYIKLPTVLTANTNTSSLPAETETLIIDMVYHMMLLIKKEFETADRVYRKIAQDTKEAVNSNNRKMDMMLVMNPLYNSAGLPRLGGNYPAGY